MAENQLAERSGSKSMSEGSSIDASPSPSKDSKKSHQNKNEFSKAALESNKIKKKVSGMVEISLGKFIELLLSQDQSKRHGKSRNASTERSSASPSPPPPPPPRRPAVEDPRIHKSTGLLAPLLAIAKNSDFFRQV